ncbi:MAG: hypothetical protein K6A80_01715 [Saccharofermentans sp.]|nr:hypothetical protein [Saccharofermentans sp.]
MIVSIIFNALLICGMAFGFIVYENRILRLKRIIDAQKHELELSRQLETIEIISADASDVKFGGF